MKNRINFTTSDKINKKLIVFIIVLTSTLFSIWIITAIFNIIRTPLNYRAFANMDELSCIDEYAVKDLDCNNDKRLNGKEYKEKYAKEIHYKGNTYYLYAYKFKNKLDAMRYCLESDSNPDLEKAYRFSYNNTTVYAFYKEYAYYIRGDNYKDFAEFYNFMVKDFTVEV